MMRWKYPAIVALALIALPTRADSGGPSFGSIQHGTEATAIQWENPTNIELSSDALRLSRPGSFARSQPLPLQPLQYYRVSTRMAREPGGTAHFAIAYLDAQGKSVEWIPSWQLKSASRPCWLPLSPHLQRYVQGFVLPLGATKPQLLLRLDAGEKALGAHIRWEVAQLRFEATHPVASCKQLGADRLLGGDFEGARQGELPAWWQQWSLTPDNHAELIKSQDARKHVLRVKPETIALLASSYVVPVVRGSAYQISLMARGHGRIELDLHSLTLDSPTPLRVGNATRSALEVHSEDWTQLSQEWFAEAPNIASAQVVITVMARTGVELDAVELRPCRGTSSP
jgi:hypothetical protein